MREWRPGGGGGRAAPRPLPLRVVAPGLRAAPVLPGGCRVGGIPAGSGLARCPAVGSTCPAPSLGPAGSPGARQRRGCSSEGSYRCPPSPRVFSPREPPPRPWEAWDVPPCRSAAAELRAVAGFSLFCCKTL